MANSQRFKICKILLCLAGCFTLQGVGMANPFYEDKQRGWFWHEDRTIEEKKEEKLPQDKVESSKPAETVELTVEWINEAIPRVMNRAINNPTDENLAAYAYLQRLALDQASRFSSRMTEFMAMESQLDEAKRRPTSSFALNSFNEERNKVVREAINVVKENTKGIFFFFASDCGYCHRMVPVLHELNKKHGIEILGISMDGGMIRGMEWMNVVEDMSNEVSDQFGVNITPTLHLVLNDNSSELIIEGLKTLPDIEDRYLFAGRKSGVLGQELYAKTRSVREINVFKNENGNLVADKERLENDPGYLAELLRMQLEEKEVFGTRRMRRN